MKDEQERIPAERKEKLTTSLEWQRKNIQDLGARMYIDGCRGPQIVSHLENKKFSGGRECFLCRDLH